MATVLGDAQLFAIPADGAEPERLARAWLTDVMQAESGAEVRAAVRSVPVRRYEFTAKFGSAAEAMHFRALWLATSHGAERLRYTVPIWMRGTLPTAFPDSSTITTDTTNRGFVADGPALLAQFDEQNNVVTSELVTLATVTDGGVTLTDPYVGTYTVGGASLVPVMNAWLEPPVVEQFGVATDRVPLVFHEELPGVSGIDPTVGVEATPVPGSISIETESRGTEWAGRKFSTLRAVVNDAEGVPIANAPVVWSVVPIGAFSLDPPTRITYPEDGQHFHMAFDGGTATVAHVTATIGALSATAAV